MSDKFILQKEENGILTVTINRPEKLNSMTIAMMMEFAEIFRRVNTNDDIRVVVVTGEGDYFSAGADISDGLAGFELSKFEGLLSENYDQDEINRLSPGSHVAQSIFDCQKPIIAAINGPAAGIGATLILPMDFRLMSEAAKIGYVFTRRGFVPEAGSSWFLPRIVGMTKASDWVLTGRLIEPEEALSSGLVNSLHHPEDLLPAAYALARELITKTSPVSLACSRQLLWKMSGAADLSEATALETSCFVDRLQHPDALEGAHAFVQKRAPNFTGVVSKHILAPNSVALNRPSPRHYYRT